jgi:Bardet-Biedl syndrome 1 protein
MYSLVLEYLIVFVFFFASQNHKLLGGPIELETMPVTLAIIDKNIYVGCMDHVIHSFHVKGKKNFSIYLPHSILCMTPMEMTSAKV